MISVNLFGGERESEFSVDVGDPIFLNLSSYVYFGTFGV
jgi:hypothetical protein